MHGRLVSLKRVPASWDAGNIPLEWYSGTNILQRFFQAQCFTTDDGQVRFMLVDPGRPRNPAPGVRADAFEERYRAKVRVWDWLRESARIVEQASEAGYSAESVCVNFVMCRGPFDCPPPNWSVSIPKFVVQHVDSLRAVPS